MEVYHKKSRTRSTIYVPRRAFYVRRFLERTLTPGTPQAISNKQIQLGVRFGSEGEVSQIMRWLAGESPTMGRWAYGALQANAQTYRFITRERTPSGAYVITLLPTPERIDAPRLALPQVVQLSFFGDTNDPPVIPHAPQQDASEGGSFSHDPFDAGDLAQQSAADRGSQRDQHEERLQTQTQEEELARSPLFAWLITQPGMSRKLARQIAKSPMGTLADFESDLKIAQTFARDPFYFTVAKWRDSERVHAPEESRDEHPARSASGARRRPRANRPAPPANPAHAADYDALLAEIRAARPLTAEELGLPVPGRGRIAHGS
jgi:hypothetical protein